MQLSGVNCPRWELYGGQLSGGNCLEVTCPRWELPGGIVRGAFVLGGNCPEGNCPAAVCPLYFLNLKLAIYRGCLLVASSVNEPALQINISPLPITMNRKIKKSSVKLNFRRSQ